VWVRADEGQAWMNHPHKTGNTAGGIRFVPYVTLVGTTGYVLTHTCTDSESALFLKQAQVLVDTFTFGSSP